MQVRIDGAQNTFPEDEEHYFIKDYDYDEYSEDNGDDF
jgi:hypothetical protein